jgi:hypothetical protein
MFTAAPMLVRARGSLEYLPAVVTSTLAFAAGVVVLACIVVWWPLHAMGLRNGWAALAAGWLVGGTPTLRLGEVAIYCGACGAVVGWLIWRVAYRRAPVIERMRGPLAFPPRPASAIDPP